MFLDRHDAGKRLAKSLLKYKIREPVVLAIPRGGVVVGYEVARKLECDFSVIIVRKLGYLQHPEAAFGAVAEDGSQYFRPMTAITPSQMEIDTVTKIEKQEIERRKKVYRENRELPRLKNRTVILVDDGIATGSTLIAAIKMCEQQNPNRLVVAAPVSSDGILRKISNMVDEVVVLETPSDFRAVSQVYNVFDPVDDEEISKIFDMYRVLQTLKKSVDSS